MTDNKLAMVTVGDMERMAAAVVKSNLFGVKTLDQALALMLISQAEGRHPALAARDYDIIQGRPSKKSEAMLRDFLESGGKVEWHQLDNDVASATFSHPSGGSVKIDWTMARAKEAGLGGKDMWRKYPRQMLRARVVSEGIRTVCPMATSGMYVPEEVQDFGREKDITPTAGVLAALPIKRQEVINETAAEVRALIGNDQAFDAYTLIENSNFDADETVALQSLLDSKQRGILSRMAEAERAADLGTISEPQRKRLEAMIKNFDLDRDDVKAWCVEHFGVEHFTELTKEHYDKLEAYLNDNAPPVITPDEALALEARCTDNAIDPAKLKKAAKVELFSQIKQKDLPRAHAWIDATLAKKKGAPQNGDTVRTPANPVAACGSAGAPSVSNQI